MEQKTKPFQVFVQDRETRTFLGSGNEWTRDAREARNFRDTASAVAHVLNYSLADAQLVLQSGRSGDRPLTVSFSWSR